MNKAKFKIGEDGCACGDYKTDNLLASVCCRKSGSSPTINGGTAHLITYKPLNENGYKELGDIVYQVKGYGCDYVVLEEVEEMMVEEALQDNK